MQPQLGSELSIPVWRSWGLVVGSHAFSSQIQGQARRKQVTISAIIVYCSDHRQPWVSEVSVQARDVMSFVVAHVSRGNRYARLRSGRSGSSSLRGCHSFPYNAPTASFPSAAFPQRGVVLQADSLVLRLRMVGLHDSCRGVTLLKGPCAPTDPGDETVHARLTVMRFPALVLSPADSSDTASSGAGDPHVIDETMSIVERLRFSLFSTLYE